jgi:hypothetical protein
MRVCVGVSVCTCVRVWFQAALGRVCCCSSELLVPIGTLMILGSGFHFEGKSWLNKIAGFPILVLDY